MKYLIITDSFKPKNNSGAIMIGDLVNELIDNNHDVTVITFKNKKQNFPDIEEKMLKVVYLNNNLNHRNLFYRALNELTYSKKIIKYLNLYNKNFDCCITYSPSIFFGKAINFVKKKYKIKTYLIVRDIFPKWAWDTGIIKNYLIYLFFKYYEKKLYLSADFIGIESYKDINYFRNITKNKNILIENLRNWSNNIISKNNKKNIFNNSNPIIIYGGNLGYAQDFKNFLLIFIKCKLFLKFNLLIIGDGAQRYKISKIIKEQNVNEIILKKPMNLNEYFYYLSNADIGLVTLNTAMKGNNFPLKCLYYFKYSKLVFAFLNQNNELIEIINKNKIGFAFSKLSENLLNEKLSYLNINNSIIRKYGENAFNYFKSELIVNKIYNKINSKFL